MIEDFCPAPNRWKPAAGGAVFSYGHRQHGGISAAGEDPHFKYFVAFDGPEVPSALDAASLRRRRHRRLANPQFVADLYDQIVACAGLRSSSRAQLADLLLRSLLVRIGFCGNSDMQVWESGDLQAIKREGLRKLNAAKGGGMIFQSDHSASSSVSGQTYDFIVKLVREYGRYPLELGESDETL
jgi:hypothetical protein